MSLHRLEAGQATASSDIAVSIGEMVAAVGKLPAAIAAAPSYSGRSGRKGSAAAAEPEGALSQTI